MRAFAACLGDPGDDATDIEVAQDQGCGVDIVNRLVGEGGSGRENID